MRTIVLHISGEYVKKSSSVAGTVGSYQAAELELHFDVDWAPYAKKIYFLNARGEDEVAVLLGEQHQIGDGVYSVPIPSEPLMYAGEMTFTIKGVVANGSAAESVVFSVRDTLRVLESRDAVAEPAAPTPSQAEQLQGALNRHTERTDNPHSVTKAQVGLGNADDTADVNKPISTAQQAALDLKLNAVQAVDFVKDVQFDRSTGQFTFFQHDGTSFTIDTVLEKVPISCRLDGTDFVLTLDDGTEQRVSLASLVDVYTFGNTATVKFSKAAGSNAYTAEIPDGAIARAKLAPEVMEEVIGLEQSARTSAETSTTKAGEAATSALVASEKAEAASASAVTASTASGVAETKASEASDSATSAASSAATAKTEADRAKTEADRAAEIAGGDIPTRTEMHEYIKTHDTSTDAHGGLFAKKVDKIAGKSLSSNDYTLAEKEKLAGIAVKANLYTHPDTHPATMIEQDTNHCFVTNAQKSAWNAKADQTALATEQTVREKADSALDARLDNLTTSLPMPTKAGQIHIADLSDPAVPRMKLAEMTGAVAKPVTGLAVEKLDTLGSLNVGDKVTFGSYNGVPIVWRIADKNHPGYPEGAVTLISDKIITTKCFDAVESRSSDSNRRANGNNRYIHSNIRQWLNSDATAGEWYTAQHSADAPPTNANVWGNCNEYDQEAGFLTGFSANMRVAILDTTHIVGKASVDGGGTETCTDKIFLASCTEVGLTGDVTCGSKLALFSSDTSRIAYPTEECVSENEFEDSNFTASKGWYWWLADAYASNSQSVRHVHTSGALHYAGAHGSDRGVRPLCNLSLESSVKSNVDGTYSVLESEGINLTWTNPTDTLFAQRTIIRRSSEGYPTGPDDGITVYEGTGQECLDETADLNVDQYYTAFTVNDFINQERTDESMMVKYEASKGYLMLYDHGDECVDVTGGWIDTPTYSGFSKGITSKTTDGLTTKVTGGGNKYAYFATRNKVKFSGYGQLGCVASVITGEAILGTASANTEMSGATIKQAYGGASGEKWAGKIDVTAHSPAFVYVCQCSEAARHSITHAAFLLKTNDYTPWLLAGNLNPSSYPTLDALLADSTAMTTLMNSSAAVDRMIRYTGTVMAGVVNSETAMTALGNSPYVTRVMQNPDWAKFLAMSPYLSVWDGQANTKKVPVMTSNTTPSGTASAQSEVPGTKEGPAWFAFDSNVSETASIAVTNTAFADYYLQYKFEKAITAYRATYNVVAGGANFKTGTSTFKIQGSSDGAVWVDLSRNIEVGNTNAVTAGEVELRCMRPYIYFRFQFVSSSLTYAHLAGSYGMKIRDFRIYGK